MILSETTSVFTCDTVCFASVIRRAWQNLDILGKLNPYIVGSDVGDRHVDRYASGDMS
jgi:hypothetical protein